MTTDATPQGVSKRDQDLAALTASRAAERDTAEQPRETTTDEGTTVAAEPTPEKGEVETIKFVDEDGKEYSVPATAAARLKIDGEEVESPLEQITRRYQKGAAGEKRLHEASRARQELTRKEQELARREAELKAKAAKPNQAGPPKDDRTYKDLAEAIAEADEDRLAEMLPNILANGQQRDSDPQELYRKVDTLVDSKIQQREQARAVKAAQDRFYQDYSDLAEDPMLFDMVDRETAAIMGKKPDAAPWEIISEAAENVKKWRTKVAGKPPKKSKVPIPTPRGGRAHIGSDPKPPMTRQEQLNEIRKARGQIPR